MMVLGKVDYTHCSTDNNCVSICIDFGENAKTPISEQSESISAAVAATVSAPVMGYSASPVKSRTEKDSQYEEEGEEYEDEDGLGDDLCNIHTAALEGREDSPKLQQYMQQQLARFGMGGVNINKTVIDRTRMILSERDTSQKQFTALKSRSTFFSVLKFETGAVIVVGLQDPALTGLCVAKAVTDIADTLKYPIRIRNVSIVNTVSTFSRFNLNFVSLREWFNRHCIAYIYNPETFPGMFFKLRVPAKKLEKGETLGEYYTKVAAMRYNGDPNFDITDWLRVKTVLTFKVGKVTVLGECGRDDVSVIAKLLFGLFHYFMDHNIKVSAREARRLRARYGIPPLVWFLHIDMFFHSHPFEKPTRQEVERAIIMLDPYCGIDKTYYGMDGACAENINAPLSANLVPSLEDTTRVINALAAQKLCGRYSRMHEDSVEMAKNIGNRFDRHYYYDSPLLNGLGRGNKFFPRERPDPFGLVHLGPSSEPVASMMNGQVARCGNEGWWFDNEFKDFKEMLVNLCYDEIVSKCEQANFIPSPCLRNNVMTHSQTKLNRLVSKIVTGSSSNNNNTRTTPALGRNARTSAIERERKKRAVDLARLNTHMAAYRFLGRQLVTGGAPKIANLLGTDVYSVLHLIKKLPLAAGHAACMGSERAAYKTPGDAYFSNVLDDTGVDNNNNDNNWSTADDEKIQPVTIIRRESQNSAANNRLAAKCKACGELLLHRSMTTESIIKLCNTCEKQSTQYIKTALNNIRGEKRKRRATIVEAKKRKGCTPSDFIDSKSIALFNDEATGTPKVGLQINVKDVLNTLLTSRGVGDRPTANYRTALHTDTQNKSNLSKLIIAALKEHGITDEEAQAFKKTFLESNEGMASLSELRRTTSGATADVKR